MTTLSLTDLARAGFTDLDRAALDLAEYSAAVGVDIPAAAFEVFVHTADPDAALTRLLALLRRVPEVFGPFLGSSSDAVRLARIAGASSGLAEFLLRHPREIGALAQPTAALPDAGDYRADLLDAVGAVDGVAGVAGEPGWVALRTRYRRRLLQVVDFDLSQKSATAGVGRVAAALADLAGAALDASLAVARADAASRFGAADVAATRLAVIGMGKAGARELNYVSDVDVIFVAEAVPGATITSARAIDVGIRLAQLTMRGADSPTVEPVLWQVDANLRPEGKDGVLVRTLESHIAYYERWASTWEFQALLKARPLAGDAELGERYVAALGPMVWTSSSREGFVESVQRMRERVTENIPAADVDYQLKLGPGGLRDIEFTVQLLQLVHGAHDPSVRQAGTLAALAALAESGYIGRVEAVQFAEDYRTLRVLEHRLQLAQLRRTHLMPRHEAAQRVLARASGLAGNAAELVELWTELKRRVRGLHERLFYRPLLAAVASLSDDDIHLSSAAAEARLAAIGFRDPRGALAHIGALTGGISRSAAIRRTLLPVLLQWFADGADPDYGLLVFRRLSEDLGETHWFLRMLRDSSGAAQRLTRLLSGSRFVGELLGHLPEAVAWLDDDEELQPRPITALRDEVDAILARHDTADSAAGAIRFLRRREVLRLAFGGILGLLTIDQLARGLSDVTEVAIAGTLDAIRRASPAPIEFAVIAMGRFGGRELGFGSDADVMYVYRSADAAADLPRALEIAAELARLTADHQLPLDLDLGLRPEGKNGPVARSLESYATYYARWSLTWEAQALLRARGVAGDPALIADFFVLADTVRYPARFGDAEVREVRRIKARVENERLPKGADPARHLKLGRGSLSDVEWLVQLEQLRSAHDHRVLRTTSTLHALEAEVDLGYLAPGDAARLREGWLIASRARSAMTLWSNRTADVLPADRNQLEGIARLMEYPPHSASRLEEDYLATTRRARAVFSRLFYGEAPSTATYTRTPR